MHAKKISIKMAAIASLLVFLAACSDANSSKQASAPAMPPPAVSIVEVAHESIPIVNELPGRIAPVRIAEVRPRVSGIVQERVFEQGSIVKEGDLLYRIDPEVFRVQVESAQATLQRAEAIQLQARQAADRQKQLRARNVSSTQQVDDAIAALAQADAEVAIAKAGLKQAQLNLDYASIKAPISGRIGRAQITEGALVSANSPESLATIQQVDPVYADFTQSASALLKLRKTMKSGSLTGSEAGEATVKLLMDDGSAYGHDGRLLFLEAVVDATTGQVTLRGEFPNPNGDLLPGMYVRVLIEQGVEQNAIAVPQQAIQRGSGGDASVYVVSAENTVELKPVKVGRTIGDRWVIDSGLTEGDKVIVEGFQKIRPGAPVNAQPWKAESNIAPTDAKEPAATAAKVTAG